MEGFLLTANLTKLAYIIAAFGLIFISAKLLEMFLGLDHDKDINCIQDQCRKGNALPLALIYCAAFILYAAVVSAVLR